MIHSFLQFLKSISVHYRVSNGYKDLYTEVLNTNDVDVLIKKTDFKKIETILKAFCEIENCKIVQIYHQEVFAKNIFLYKEATEEILNLDLYGKLHKNNNEFFTELEIFGQKKYYKEVSILNTHQEFFYYFIKKISKPNFSIETFSYLRNLYFEDQNNCDSALRTYLKKTGESISSAFLNDDFSFIVNNTEIILSDLDKKNVPISYWIKDKIRILKRIIKPTGISIAFLGPDGSGKTTIINGLLNSNLPFRRNDYFHLKPIYPKNKSEVVTSNPHQYEPYNAFKSIAKLIYFVCQYNIGWLKNIIPLKIKSSLVIFDRYYDDLIADNKRYRYGGGNYIANFFRVFIKKPALYFILVTDPDIIYKRKQEVLFSELQTQVEKYRGLADGKRYFEIDVNNEPSLIVKRVNSILMKRMNERY